MSVFGISKTTTNACDIEFVPPGVIDIEQLSFASRQHVVAYRVGGSALVDSPPRRRNGNGAPLLSSRGGGGTLEIVVEFGITLNVRYPAPIITSSAASGRGAASPARNNNDGLVPIVMQQPVLFSASAGRDNAGNDELTGR
jgi:hypothetical protein